MAEKKIGNWGYITLLIGVTILSITCRGPPLATNSSYLPRTPGPKRNVTTTIEFQLLLLLVSGSVNFVVGEGSMIPIYLLPSLKLTAKTPENGWLEDDRFLLGPGLFSGAMLVSGKIITEKNRVWLPVPFWVHCKCEQAFFHTKWGM